MTEAALIADQLEHVIEHPEALDELRGRIEALPDQLEKDRLRRIWATADQYLSKRPPPRLDQVDVHSPPHYQANGVEAIDVIEAFGLAFHLGNALKYLLRADRKGTALTDLRKAVWYIEREIARRERP